MTLTAYPTGRGILTPDSLSSSNIVPITIASRKAGKGITSRAAAADIRRTVGIISWWNVWSATYKAGAVIVIKKLKYLNDLARDDKKGRE